jgi:hypothetical protein
MEALGISENRSDIETLADPITSFSKITLQGIVMQIYTPNADKFSR